MKPKNNKIVEKKTTKLLKVNLKNEVLFQILK